MKKRYLLLGLLMMIPLASCSVLKNGDNSSESKASKYTHITGNHTGEELSAAYQNVEGACVMVGTEYKLNVISVTPYYSMMSGVIYKHVGSNYYVVSAYDSSITLKQDYDIIIDKNTRYSATLVAYDSYNGLASYKFISTEEYDIAPISLDSELKGGTQIFSVYSYAFSGMTSYLQYPYEELDDILFDGTISNFDGREMLHTACTGTVSMGSGVFDYDGNLIGINTRSLNDTGEDGENLEEWNFAIAGNALASIVDDLESSAIASVSRVSLNHFSGQMLIDVDEDENDEQSDMVPGGNTCGIYVGTTPTGFANLKSTDIITRVNGEVAYDFRVLKNACYLKKASDTVKLEVYRLDENDVYQKIIITNS